MTSVNEPANLLVIVSVREYSPLRLSLPEYSHLSPAALGKYALAQSGAGVGVLSADGAADCVTVETACRTGKLQADKLDTDKNRMIAIIRSLFLTGISSGKSTGLYTFGNNDCVTCQLICD